MVDLLGAEKRHLSLYHPMKDRRLSQHRHWIVCSSYPRLYVTVAFMDKHTTVHNGTASLDLNTIVRYITDTARP